MKAELHDIRKGEKTLVSQGGKGRLRKALRCTERILGLIGGITQLVHDRYGYDGRQLHETRFAGFLQCVVDAR